MVSKMKRGCPAAVLLDRDGTIIVEKEYLSDPAGVELLPGAAAGLRALRALGCLLAVVTNQSGVGRGYYTLDTMHAVNRRMAELLAREGIVLDGIYFCPHAPGSGCACRKPLPGMGLQAARELGFEPRDAVIIGDKLVDLGLAGAMGARGILVRTGYGRDEERRVTKQEYISVADDLPDAARMLQSRPHNGLGSL